MDERTSARVALQLRRAGWPHARALIGGWQKWIDEGMPVERQTMEV